MAENSALWLGSTLGDAASSTGWKGPYSHIDYANILSLILSNNNNTGFVLPGYNNNLAITANTPAAMNVLVDTGIAFLYGKIYENTSQSTLTIAANASGNPRIDRIILRYTAASQTIRLVILEGAPNVSPTLPALTQTSATYEISLGYAWVANAAASITSPDIHDEREFINTYAAINDFYGTNNLIYNSEFMGFSELGTAPITLPPDGWDLVLTPSALASSTKPPQMSRGRAIQITTDAASEGISQTMPIKASTLYAIKLLTWVTAGDVGSISVTTNSAAPGTITRYTRRVGEWVEEKIYYSTEADASSMSIQLLGLNNTDIIRYGQTILAEGYYTGEFRQINEIICFTDAVWDANWGTAAGTVVKGSGTYTIDFDVDYQAIILPGTKAVIVAIQAADPFSGAPNTSYIRVCPYNLINNTLRLELSSETNNSTRYQTGWVTLDSNSRITYQVVGAGGLNITLKIYIEGISI